MPGYGLEPRWLLNRLKSAKRINQYINIYASIVGFNRRPEQGKEDISRRERNRERETVGAFHSQGEMLFRHLEASFGNDRLYYVYCLLIKESQN